MKKAKTGFHPSLLSAQRNFHPCRTKEIRRLLFGTNRTRDHRYTNEIARQTIDRNPLHR